MKWLSYSAWMMVWAGLFLLFMVTPWFEAVAHLSGGTVFLGILGGCIGILLAPAAIVIWVGMLWYCITLDRSTRGEKALWCMAFFSAGWFASAVYFFRVYRKQRRQALP